MKPHEHIRCNGFPCLDVNKSGYNTPSVDIRPDRVKAVVISEAPSEKREDYFYSAGEPLYLKTTLQAFNDAGVSVSSLQDILDLGFYLTTAVKCAKTQYSISATTVKNCSLILERELAQFPDMKVYLLMGDVAIKAFNYISKRKTGENTIPTGSTYKIRKNQFYYEGKRVFPSYVQTGQNYLIEKSKRVMIAEDLAEAMNIMKL
jgi:uracil-DNA glycosylase